jgi:hypothetical protein
LRSSAVPERKAAALGENGNVVFGGSAALLLLG